jgi:hypothetical protein
VLVPARTQFCFYPTLYKPRNQEPTRRSQGLFACAVNDGLSVEGPFHAHPQHVIVVLYSHTVSRESTALAVSLLVATALSRFLRKCLTK